MFALSVFSLLPAFRVVVDIFTLLLNSRLTSPFDELNTVLAAGITLLRISAVVPPNLTIKRFVSMGLAIK